MNTVTASVFSTIGIVKNISDRFPENKPKYDMKFIHFRV